MIIRASQKTNANGWRKQIVIDTDNKTITTGTFLFYCGDIDDLTTKQYKQIIDCFTFQGFEKKEG